MRGFGLSCMKATKTVHAHQRFGGAPVSKPERVFAERAELPKRSHASTLPEHPDADVLFSEKWLLTAPEVAAARLYLTASTVSRAPREGPNADQPMRIS